MKEETAKFKKYGGFFWALLLGIGFGVPFLISLFICLFAEGPFRVDVFLGIGLVFAFIAWVILLMMIGYGSLTKIFVNRTADKIEALPYCFNSSFSSRGGILYIDVEGGMIGYISAYNPLEIQVFSASRIEKPQTIASTMSGVRFVFYLDGKKMTVWTLISNRMVNLKSGMGAEAVSKADAFVELLSAAKRNAEAR
ncbi:MAG: hypothetical protein K2N98_07075 [Lachnospiraceae bacterium]|nr:hypothetical protein [Lachnospiraceae bacterium]